jgi:hypothetical protein
MTQTPEDQPTEPIFDTLLHDFATVFDLEKKGEMSPVEAEVAIAGLIDIAATYGIDPRARMQAIDEGGTGWD